MYRCTIHDSDGGGGALSYRLPTGFFFLYISRVHDDVSPCMRGSDHSGRPTTPAPRGERYGSQRLFPQPQCIRDEPTSQGTTNPRPRPMMLPHACLHPHPPPTAGVAPGLPPYAGSRSLATRSSNQSPGYVNIHANDGASRLLRPSLFVLLTTNYCSTAICTTQRLLLKPFRTFSRLPRTPSRAFFKV